VVPFSNLKWNILEVMKRYNFIADLNKIGRGSKKMIEITLKYRKINRPKFLVLNEFLSPRAAFMLVTTIYGFLKTSRV